MSGDAHSPRIAGQKRPRVDNELHHDPDLWLSDGNIVLTTKDDEGKLWGFRCHKSLLSRHSTVFNDMFTLNQPEDAELHECLPVVTLTDSYADMKALLHVLFDPVEYLPKPANAPQLCHQRELSALSGQTLQTSVS